MNSTYTIILEVVVFMAILYFLIIRPQQRKEKETQKMRSSLKEGDEIVTIGGIYGKIVNIKEDVITIEVGADKVKIKIAKWAIGRTITKEEK